MLTPGDPRHGSVNGYTNHHCRCDDCRVAMSAYYRQLRGGTKPKQPGKYNVLPSTGNGIKTSDMVRLEIELGLAISDFNG